MPSHKAFAALDADELNTRSREHDGDSWRPIVPVPDDAPKLTMGTFQMHSPVGYAFTNSWSYHDAGGRLIAYVARYDRPENGTKPAKQFLPFTYCKRPDGCCEWRCKSPSEPRPLFGLDRLAARPDALVLVVEGEKKVAPASALFPDHVVVTSPNGSNSARKSDWSVLAKRAVTIWPDNDQPGAHYVDDVVDMLRKAGVASIRVVRIPEGWPESWDLADDLPAGVTEADLERMLAEAEPVRADGAGATDAPIPLFPSLPPAEPFPIESMGPVLSRAAAAISRKIQVPEAIAAQSVLAAAALAAQAHADVMSPYGQTRPLSLFLVTVAASGDRKSTADNEALWPVRKHEKGLKEKHEREQSTWSIASAAWNAEKKRIEGDRKMGFEARKQALVTLGPEPDRPLHPFMTVPDPTVEGLAKAWVNAPASLGVFTAEGGQFIGGHGMSNDNRLKTAATYSEKWDGRPIKRVRSHDGVTILHGRRLSMHLMVQKDVAGRFLADELLKDQGLLSRVLVAAPDSIAGTRFYRNATPEDDAAIRSYGARILSILEASWPLAESRQNELEPRALRITDEAAKAWRAFHDHVEGQCGAGKELQPIQDFAAKAAEHAARLAGVLTIVTDFRADKIGLNAMEPALELADWYVNEAVRLQRAARTDDRLLRAQQLLGWIRERQEAVIGFREIIQYGPGPLRIKSAAEEAVSILKDHGWLTELSGRPRRVRLVSEEPGA